MPVVVDARAQRADGRVGQIDTRCDAVADAQRGRLFIGGLAKDRRRSQKQEQNQR